MFPVCLDTHEPNAVDTSIWTIYVDPNQTQGEHTMLFFTLILKTRCCSDINFVVIGGTLGCRHDNAMHAMTEMNYNKWCIIEQIFPIRFYQNHHILRFVGMSGFWVSKLRGFRRKLLFMCTHFLQGYPIRMGQSIVWPSVSRLTLTDFHNTMTPSNGTIFGLAGPFWSEFTGYRWIPLIKASDAELWCFRWSAPEQTVVKTIKTSLFWDVIALIMTLL